jgi:hypothetical protein
MRRGLRAATVLLVAACACGRGRRGAVERTIAPGDSLAFRDGLGSEQPETEKIVARGGFAHVFLPAVRLERRVDAWKAADVAPPEHPFAGPPVVLVVDAGADRVEGLETGAGGALAAAIEEALGNVLARRASFGRVEGVHLQISFPLAAAEAFGAVATRVRKAVPADLFLTCALEGAPPEKVRVDFRRHLAAVDGFVAEVFGEGAKGDLVGTDALEKPWWAGYVPGARGEWKDASGASKGVLTERYLSALADEPLAPLSQELSLSREEVASFSFHPTARFTIAGTTFEPGDQIAFRQPSVSELLYRLGSDLTGRKVVRGRLIRLDGIADSQRLFTLAGLSDVLLGRPLLPELRVRVVPGPEGIRVEAENLSDHASVLSRTTNWIEVDVPPGQVRDVQLGGFDRYEVFDADGRPVTPGRASRLRLHELLIAPRERIAAATILLRTRPGPDCCRFRQHLLAASGPEVAGDWIAPPPPPTPTPKPPPSRAKKRR